MAWDRLSQGADLQEWLTNEIAIHDLIQKDRAPPRPVRTANG